MKNNIYLFQPQFAVEIREENNYWLPYSVGCLWSYCQQFEDITSNFDMKDFIFKREDPQAVLDRLDNPKICGFSLYVWNERYCEEMAKMVKAKFPDCIIVIGGPQANVTWTVRDHVDVVILAEGEVSFVDLLRKYTAGERLPKEYKKERLMDLDIPSPYTSGVFDKIIADNPKALWSMTLETNRGCPYQCTFCDWGGTTYSKVKRFGLERIEEELNWAADNPVAFIFCADANFGMFKQRDLEIARMIRSCADRGKLESVNLQYAKNSTEIIFEIAKTLDHLHKGITVSVQSMNDDTLVAIKRKNMDINNISHMLDMGRKYGIGTYSEVILGLPEETLETWRDGMSAILEMGQHDAIDVYFCQLLENSELNSPMNRFNYQIKTTVCRDYLTFANPQDYQGIEEEILLVKSTNTMTTDDIVEAYMYTWLIINFHIAGFTQWYARYLYEIEKISYRQFYDQLFEEIKKDPLFGQHYFEYKEMLSKYLNEGTFDTSLITYGDKKARAHGLATMSSKLVYDNKEQARKLGRNVFDTFSNNGELVDKIQENFVYDHNTTFPLTYELPFDIRDWSNTPCTYTVNPKNKPGKAFDYFFERRRGGLKNKFTIEPITLPKLTEIVDNA